jgi:hypothetical protein
MCKLHPEDEDARAQVKRFCKLVFELRIVHDIGKELFYDEQARSLMERTAHHFFLDLNRIVMGYFLLEVAKLTDPASSRTRAGEVENFTIANVLERIQWPQAVSKKLQKLSEAPLKLRGYIKEARNRLLAHYDKKTFLSGETLGAFPEGEDEKAMDTLEEMCNVLHEASFGSVYGAMAQAHAGDVRDLKLALMKALAFERVKENASKELCGLMINCLSDIKKGNI